MQVIGYYLKFETDQTIPPLCAVLSEKCFPYTHTHDRGVVEVVDCLVLPELPLFLDVIVAETIPTAIINRYLLVLMLLWTKQDACLYRDRIGVRDRIGLPGATKKSAVRDHIQSMKERMEAELREVEEKLRKDGKKWREDGKETERSGGGTGDTEEIALLMSCHTPIVIFQYCNPKGHSTHPSLIYHSRRGVPIDCEHSV